MIEFGEFALRVALVTCACGMALALAALVSRRRPFLDAALRCLHVDLLCVGLATLALALAFLEPAGAPMRLKYVWQHSSRDMAAFYKLTALWGGMSGSMLFWLLLLALFSVLAFLGRSTEQQIGFHAGTTFTLLLVQLFFLIMVVAIPGAQPFERLPVPLLEGRGLNPLLQNAMMAIHPPLLYVGFVAMSVPFAFAMGALLSGDLGTQWISICRRWTILGWGVLACGIALGSRWAYVELGWGGVWAWDPVENASLMPWLAMTAFLHSVMIQEHRGMLKTWNMVLILLAFLMTIFGTFLTRSGILDSVHTFALNKELGITFLAFMGFVLAGGATLIVVRRRHLRSENRMESFLSREFAFLAANVVLLSLMLTILVGTMLPWATEQLGGTKIAVGPSYFNVLCYPQFLLLLFLTGYGPLVAWRKASRANLLRNFTAPAALGLASGLAVLAYLLLGDSGIPLRPAPLAAGTDFFRWLQEQVLLGWGTIAIFAVGGFVLGCLALEVVRGARVQRQRKAASWPGAVVRLCLTNRRRYGGYTVHLGLVTMFFGLVLFSVFGSKIERELAAGESLELRGYTLHYRRSLRLVRPEYTARQDWIEIRRGDRRIGMVYPENRQFAASEQNTSEVGLLVLPQADIYVVPVGRDERAGKATFLVFYNPWINLFWLGVLIQLCGGAFAAWPGPPPRARAGRRIELSPLALRIPA